jgi:hypothetical protein
LKFFQLVTAGFTLIFIYGHCRLYPSFIIQSRSGREVYLNKSKGDTNTVITVLKPSLCGENDQWSKKVKLFLASFQAIIYKDFHQRWELEITFLFGCKSPLLI